MRKNKEENKNIIEIKEEVQVGDTILEPGDRVEILNEMDYSINNSEDLVDLVYNTLMENKQYPQLDLKRIDNSEVDISNRYIEFEYQMDDGRIALVKMNFDIEIGDSIFPKG